MNELMSAELNFTKNEPLRTLVLDSTDFDSLKHFGIFQELFCLCLNATNNTCSFAISLLDKIKYLQPYSNLFGIADQISGCFGQIIGFIDLGIIPIKIYCVHRWATIARAQIAELKNKESFLLNSKFVLSTDSLKFVKEQEAKLLAEEFTAYYDLRRLFFGSFAQVVSSIGFIASLIPTVSTTVLIPLSAVTEIFNFAVALVNKSEMNRISSVQNRLIKHIDNKKTFPNLTTETFQALSESEKVSAFFHEAMKARIQRENIFIGLLSVKNTVCTYYSMIAASLGVAVTIAALAGGPIAPLGLLLIGTSAIGIIITAGFGLLYQGLLIYYKRDFFLAILTGSNSRLITYRVIYNTLKCFVQPDAWWMKSFKDHWIGKHKIISEEAGWSDLLRYMPDDKFKEYKNLPVKKLKAWVKDSADPDAQLLHPSHFNEMSFYIDALLQWSYAA